MKIKSSCLVRSTLTFLLLGLIASAGCVTKYAVGDAAKSKVDKTLVGYWHAEIGRQSQLLAVSAFDDRAYVVEMINYQGDLSQPKVTQRTTFKAWLTKIKGKTFITMKGLQPQNLFSKNFVVGKLTQTNDSLTFNGLAPKYQAFKNATSREQLEKAIAANIEDGDAFGPDQIYTKKSYDADGLKVFFGGRR